MLRPATLKQGQALVFGRRKLGVHRLGRTDLVGQWYQLAVVEPLRRYRLAVLAFGIQLTRAKVLRPTRRLQMQGKHDGLLNLSALRVERCLVWPEQLRDCPCDVRVFCDVFAWRLKALGVAKTELVWFEA